MIDTSDYFKEGTIVLQPNAGDILTLFSQQENVAKVTTGDRIMGGDITQIHFFDENDEIISSLYVDYQEEDGRLGAPNICQEVSILENGDFNIQFLDPDTVHLIEVLYHEDASREIKQAHEGEWCDLRSAYDVTIKQGERYLIDLGVSIKVPPNYEAIMAPRSSTFKNYGVLQTNGIGVFDERYCGNTDKWYFPCYATRDTTIAAGDRIAQFKIQKIQGKLKAKEVTDMGVEARGGLGSTGKQ